LCQLLTEKKNKKNIEEKICVDKNFAYPLVEKSLADNKAGCESEFHFWGKATDFEGYVGNRLVWIRLVDKNHAR